MPTTVSKPEKNNRSPSHSSHTSHSLTLSPSHPLSLMKHLFLITLLLLSLCTSATSNALIGAQHKQPLIHIKVKNNSMLPHKYTLIGYEPGQTGNWTNSFMLVPGARRSFNLPVGTKIYQANDGQIGTVMGGGSIRNDVPFVIVKAEDEGKVFRLK